MENLSFQPHSSWLNHQNELKTPKNKAPRNKRKIGEEIMNMFNRKKLKQISSPKNPNLSLERVSKDSKDTHEQRSLDILHGRNRSHSISLNYEKNEEDLKHNEDIEAAIHLRESKS